VNEKKFKIKGFAHVTLLDWPGKIAAMIFTPKCNFRCPFCYNKELVLDSKKLEEIPEEKIIKHLTDKKKWLDGLVISGGEPTLWPGLFDFCKKIKDLGFKVQLQTNGSNPDVLFKLIKSNIVDYIAMDIKGPLLRYPEITKSNIDIQKIKESALLVKNSKLDKEFRTTIVPNLIKEKDIEQIGKDFGGNISYFIQAFLNQKTLDKSFENLNPYSKEKFETIKTIAKKYFKRVEMRGV